jgi:tRNA (mo5U34)-methyltransferase
MNYLQESKQKGTSPQQLQESPHWRPSELPGRKPFDLARAILESRVQPVVGDFMAMDLSALGTFDVVFLLGVLYHMEDPLRAMRRVASLTKPGGLTVIETEAMEIPGLRGAFCEFFPGNELNNDHSNWWAPNARALEGLCRAAGFREIKVLTKVPRPLVSVSQWVQSIFGRGANSFQSHTGDLSLPRDGCIRRYRLIAHAMN